MWGERGLRRAKGPSLPESPGGVHRPPGFPSHELGALRSARRKHTCPLSPGVHPPGRLTHGVKSNGAVG